MNVTKKTLRIVLTFAMTLAPCFTFPPSALATQPVTETIFEESFESPIVEGFLNNSIPDTGWVGSTQGYGAMWRGLYNEDDGSVFTTPYGDQAYLLDYTNSGLTTAESKISDTLVPGITYTVSFNASTRAGETVTCTYAVDILAFNPGESRDDARPGVGPAVTLATTVATVSGSDMSAAGTVSFTADENDPSLGMLLAVRIRKNFGDVFYDNIVLTRTYLPTGPSVLVEVPGADNGGCTHDFRIAMGEQTVGSYVTFLNSADLAASVAIDAGRVTDVEGTNTYCLTTDANTASQVSYDGLAAAGERFSAVSGKDGHPMVFVSWLGAAAYCNWLSQQEGLTAVYDPAAGWNADGTADGYRLPTEAEWYKAAAWNPVTQTFFTYGTGSDELSPDDANYLASGDAAEGEAVGTLPYTGYPAPSSPYGIFDATGNVWEWCQHTYDESGPARAVRGGSWATFLRDLEATERIGFKPEMCLNTVGFRIVLPTVQP